MWPFKKRKRQKTTTVIVSDYVFCAVCGVAVNRSTAKRVLTKSFALGMHTNHFCQQHAPAYDIKVLGGSGATFYRKRSDTYRVNEDGTPWEKETNAESTTI